jgi:membrane protease YdiL (CAAX protease family)
VDIRTEERGLKGISESTWTFVDVLVVYVFVLGSSFIFYVLCSSILTNEKTVKYLFRYFVALTGIFGPIFWIKKRHNLPGEALGITKKTLKTSRIIIIGAIPALVSSLLFWIVAFLQNSFLPKEGFSYSFIQLLLIPLSISGFSTIVLSPISEEIIDRGFMYGYLRGKVGVTLGLLLQAFLFSLLHFDYLYGNIFLLIGSRFFIGLILGILYERTGSLYPSMVCHGIFNYLAIIFLAWWK